MSYKYQYITKFDSPNYTPNAQVARVFGIARSIDGVTYHWWGDPKTKPTFDGVVSWLCRAGGNSSAHNVGEGGKLACIIDHIHASWHAGHAIANATRVSYECNPRLSDDDYNMMAMFHYEMELAHKKPLAIDTHNKWINTACSPIDTSRIRRLADNLHKTGAMLKTATVAQVRQAYLDILEREADPAGITTYTTNGMSIEQVRVDLANSAERKKLEAKKAAEYKKLEWVRNLSPYTSGDKLFEKSVELLVLPAAGTKRFNLETGELLNNEVIPRGTSVSIVAKTKVNGADYFISSSSKKAGQAVGLRADELGVPVAPPTHEKPEWLANLQDIADINMWTRSEAPVLNIADGTTIRTLPINTPVHITHATHIAGGDYLVLEGGKEVIATVFLSDSEITRPNNDIAALGKRVSALEKLINLITAFLSETFKSFKK